MFVAHHFDTHSTTNHPTSPNSDPFPCSLSPAGSVLDGLGFAHPSQSRQLAWPNRVHLRCGLGVSHSVAPDHASRHRPYSVLLVLSRFNNAGLSPALISAPWRTRAAVPRSRGSNKDPTLGPCLVATNKACTDQHGAEGPDALQVLIKVPMAVSDHLFCRRDGLRPVP